MIVLDEQLLGRNLDSAIAGWYRGAVCFITDLRPNTVIKDQAIPSLLRQQRQPTFVTINERDFWEGVTIDPHFCVVCFAIPDSQVGMIPQLLRNILRHPRFRTKAQRMGNMIRVTNTDISYYAWNDQQIRSISSK